MAIKLEIIGDYSASASASIRQAVKDVQTLGREAGTVANEITSNAARERDALKQLAAEFGAVAAAAKKGSSEQVAAARLAEQAQRQLAGTVKATSEQSALSIRGLNKEASGLHGTVSKLSGSMALWLGAPALGAGLASAIHGAQQYNASLEQLHTQAGATQAEVTRMNAALLTLGPQVATTASVLSTGLYHLESQGLRGAKALDTLRIAAEGARIGNANLEDVTNALGAVVVSGIKGSQDYARAMGELNATVGAGDMRMQDLADAMGTGLPAKAAIYGASLRDVSAALAVFGDNNIRGAEAGTQLGSALRLMAAPSKAASKVLGDIGLSATQLADDLRNQGLVAAVTDLKTHMEQMGLSASQQGEVLTRAFGGKQAGGIMILIDQLDRLKSKVADVGDGGTKFGRDWQAYTQQSQFATQKFQAALETLRIEVGNALLPEFTKVTNSLSAWIDKENKSGNVTRDVRTAINDLVDAFKVAHSALVLVDGATGSFLHTLEALAALKVAFMVSRWTTGLASIGTSATVAEGEVGGLRAALLGLGAPEVLAALAAAYGGLKLIENMSQKTTVAPASYGPQLKAGESIANVQNDIGFYTASGQTQSQGYFALVELEKLMQKAGTVVSTAAQVAQATKKAVDDIAKIPSSMASDASAARANVGKTSALYGVNAGVDLKDENPIIPEALSALGQAGYQVQVTSGYRTEAQQAALYARYVKSGFNIKYIAAKPGQSNHESGNAVDVYVNGKPVDQSAGALAILKQYGLVADVAGDHEHLDYVGGSTTPTGLTNGAGNSALQAMLDGTGGGKTKRIPNAKVPAAWKHALAVFDDNVTSVQLSHLKDAQASAVKAINAESGVANKQAAIDAVHKQYVAASDRLITEVKKGWGTALKDFGTHVSSGQLEQLKKSEQSAITAIQQSGASSTDKAAAVAQIRSQFAAAQGKLNKLFAAAAKKTISAIEQRALGPANVLSLDQAAGQPAAVILSDQKNLLAAYQGEASSLESKLRSSTGKAKTEFQTALTKIQSNVASTRDQVAQTLQSIAQSAQTRLTNLLGTIQTAADYQLGLQYDQGTLTPLEKQLQDMQQQDQLTSLQQAIDQATTPADKAAAQRQLDEFNLSIKATQERADMDKRYAAAEYNLTQGITRLSENVGDGASIQGDLNTLLGQFNIHLSDLADPGGNGLLAQLTASVLDTKTAFGDLVTWIGKTTGNTSVSQPYGSNAPAPTTPTAIIGSNVHKPGLQLFADGGPTGSGGGAFPAILHPNEYVVPQRGALVLRGGRAGGDVNVNVTVAGGLSGDTKRLARQLAGDIRDELVKIGRREPSIFSGQGVTP